MLIAALIAQNERRAAELRHDQVCIAISIDIRNGNRARLTQLDRIEVHMLSNIGPALAPQISKQPEFPSVTGLTRSDKIEPAVIVVIKRRNSPAALPAEIGKRYALQPFPLHIPPQADARRACVREGQIHPAIFIEIQSHHADSGR